MLTAIAHDSHGLLGTSAPVSIKHHGGRRVRFLYLGLKQRLWDNFQQWFFLNVNYTNSSGALELNSQILPFNFLNVACGPSNTLVRFDTANLRAAGEYRTVPLGKPGYPAAEIEKAVVDDLLYNVPGMAEAAADVVWDHANYIAEGEMVDAFSYLTVDYENEDFKGANGLITSEANLDAILRRQTVGGHTVTAGDLTVGAGKLCRR
jgi:hypothetical protein